MTAKKSKADAGAASPTTIAARRYEVELLMSLGTTAGQIDAIVSEQFGCCPETVRNDRKRVKQEIDRRLKDDRDAHRAVQLSMAHAVFRQAMRAIPKRPGETAEKYQERVDARAPDLNAALGALKVMGTLTGTRQSDGASKVENMLARLAEIAAGNVGAAVGGAMAVSRGREGGGDMRPDPPSANSPFTVPASAPRRADPGEPLLPVAIDDGAPSTSEAQPKSTQSPDDGGDSPFDVSPSQV